MQPSGVHGVTPVKCALLSLSHAVVASFLIFALEHVKVSLLVEIVHDCCVADMHLENFAVHLKQNHCFSCVFCVLLLIKFGYSLLLPGFSYCAYRKKLKCLEKMNSRQGAVNVEHERSECLLSTAVRYCSRAPIRQLACVAVALN